MMLASAALCLAACATHKPPPEPKGPLTAINGDQQAGMDSPGGGCYTPITKQADPWPDETKVKACPRQ